MKTLVIFGPILLLLGAILLAIPYHMQMTGLVLVLVGLVMVVSWLLWRRPTRKKQTFISVLAILASSGVICLMAAMNIITTSGQPDWARAGQADYAVVLGANVKTDGTASRIMRQRLRAAVEFMEKNPDAMVILSGGKGDDEPISEAECMYRTIVEMGADPSRLLLEENSVDTRDNLMFSWEIIESRGGTEKAIAVITSEFHQRRAGYIGDALGIETCAVPAHTDQWFYRVNYTLREVFAFVKAALVNT